MNAFLERVGRKWTGAAILAGLTLFLFGGAANHRLTLDGKHFAREDRRVQEFDVGAMLTRGYWSDDKSDPARAAGPSDLYRPLTLVWISAFWHCATDAQRAEERPVALNLANLALHAAGVVLRFWLIAALLAGRPRAGAMALLAAIVLAVHPAAVEAVCTQVGAAEGLAVVLSSAALLAWLRWERGGSFAWAAALASSLFLALLAKENAVAVAALAPLGSLIVLRAGWRRSCTVALVAAVPVMAWLAIRRAIFGFFVGVGDPVLAGFDPLSARLTALATLGSYDLMALFWPARLLAVVGLQNVWPADSFADGRVLAGAGVIVALLAGFAAGWRRDRVVAFGIAFFAIALFPVTNLVVMIGAVSATRFLYFPLTGLGLVFAIGVARLARGPSPSLGFAVAATCLVPVFFAVFTLREVPVWASEETLYETMAVRADDVLASGNLGTELAALAGRAEGARDAAKAGALRSRALAAFERAAASKRPLIPGTDLVPEDVLEGAFKAESNAAFVSIEIHDVDRARKHEAAARDLAAQAGAQSARVHGTTRWAPLEAEAESALAQMDVVAAQAAGVDEARRKQLLADGEGHVARARALDPEIFHADMVGLEIARARGDAAGRAAGFEDLYRRARPAVARLTAALDAVRGYADFLDQSGQRERATRILLEAALEGRDRVGDPDLFFQAAKRGLASSDPATKALARTALSIFLERADQRHARQKAEAARLVGV